jgi:hypothetical protein
LTIRLDLVWFAGSLPVYYFIANNTESCPALGKFVSCRKYIRKCKYFVNVLNKEIAASVNPDRQMRKKLH